MYTHEEGYSHDRKRAISRWRFSSYSLSPHASQYATQYWRFVGEISLRVRPNLSPQ